MNVGDRIRTCESTKLIGFFRKWPKLGLIFIYPVWPLRHAHLITFLFILFKKVFIELKQIKSMIGIKDIIEFLVGLFLIPFTIKWVIILLFAYLSILDPNLIYYGPFVLQGILALILFRYKRTISIGLIFNIIFRILLPFGIQLISSYVWLFLF